MPLPDQSAAPFRVAQSWRFRDGTVREVANVRMMYGKPCAQFRTFGGFMEVYDTSGLTLLYDPHTGYEVAA